MLDTTALRTPGPEFPGIKTRALTLIRIADDRVAFAIGVGDKRNLLQAPSPDAVFLAVWTGQYRSDVFDVPPALLASWRSTLA